MTFKMLMFLFTMSIIPLLGIIIFPFLKKISYKMKILDYPNNRKIHVKKMPCLGGIGIAIIFYFGILFIFGFTKIVISMILSSLFVLLIGLIDDIYDLNFKVKLFFQIIASIIFISFGENYIIQFSRIEDKIIFSNNFSYILSIIWLVIISNAVNLIDGLDGLASGVCSISSFCLGFLCILSGNNTYAMISFIFGITTLFFLKYNFYPASIFMGNSGALFLGFTLGQISILGALKGATFISIVLLALILGMPLLDVLFAICRRLLLRKHIMLSDNEHIHYRLMKKGFNHKQAVLFIYAISLILALTGILVNKLKNFEIFFVVFFVVIIILFLFYEIGILKNISRK